MFFSSLCTFSLSPGFQLFVRMYDDDEVNGSKRNGKVVRRVVFTVRHISVRTHKFSNPLFSRFGILVVVIISYLYVHPHVPSILFSLSRLCWCVEENFPLDTRTCMGWFLPSPEHVAKYNQFYFVRTHPDVPQTKISLLPPRLSNFSILWKFYVNKFLILLGMERKTK